MLTQSSTFRSLSMHNVLFHHTLNSTSSMYQTPKKYKKREILTFILLQRSPHTPTIPMPSSYTTNYPTYAMNNHRISHAPPNTHSNHSPWLCHHSKQHQANPIKLLPIQTHRYLLSSHSLWHTLISLTSYSGHKRLLSALHFHKKRTHITKLQKYKITKQPQRTTPSLVVSVCTAATTMGSHALSTAMSSKEKPPCQL